MPKEKGVTLSPKHGLNPAIPKCFYCGKDKNELWLLGKLPNDAEAPKGMCFDKEPCDECKDHMKKGVILISVDPLRSTDVNNPYRTGGWVVVKDDFISRLLESAVASRILKERVAFMPDDIWDATGLPRGAA